MASSAAWIGAKGEEVPEILGPILGHVDSHQALIWMKSPRAGTFELRITGPAPSDTQNL